MIIDQLPSVGTPSLTDETVTEQGQNLFKVTWQRLLALFKGNTALSELSNDAGFVNATQAAAAAPVQSVDGRTGAVTTLSSTMPSPLGTATPGTADYAARADHVHAIPTADDVGAMSAWELLWTNASPTSAFAAQTVAMDLSGYDAVLIKFASNFDSGNITQLALKGEVTILIGGYTHFFWRRVTVSNSGCAFDGSGFLATYGTSQFQSNDNYFRPIAIYGIKGVG